MREARCGCLHQGALALPGRNGETELVLGRRTIAVLLAFSCAMAAWPAVASATFPGRNGRIAYVDEGRRANSRAIFSVRPDGTGRRVLVRGEVHSHAYSPNGRRIVLTTMYGDGFADVGLVVARADGRDRRRLTRRADGDADWSPDGRRLAFYREHPCERYDEKDGDCPPRFQRSTQHGLLVYVRGRTRVITHHARHPSWSPDDRWIAFTGELASGPTAGLQLIRPDGSDIRRDISPESVGEGEPDWSPDGRRIAFSYYSDPEQSGTTVGIATIRPDGTDFRPLTTSAWGPSYSPDGRWIVFARPNLRCGVEGGGTMLWIVRADGTQQRPLRYLSGGRICGSQPDWQPLR